MKEAAQEQPIENMLDCREVRNWPPLGRRIAVILWSGFLGAALMLLALVFAWDPVLVKVDEPTWGILTGAFLIGWVIASLSAMMTLALARPPCSSRTNPDGFDEGKPKA